MAFRSGSTRLTVIGALLLLGGAAAMTSPLWSTGVARDPYSTAAALICGFAPAAWGAVLAFGRKGVVLDPRAGVVTTWCGAFGFRRSESRALSEYNAVSVGLRPDMKNPRRDKAGEVRVPVALTGQGESVELSAPLQYGQAATLAEAVATFLKLKLVDSAGGEEVIRDAETLGESLRQHAHREGRAVALPDLPAGSRLRCEVCGRTLRIAIPPVGFRKRHAAAARSALVPLAIWAGFLVMHLATGRPEADLLYLLGAIFLFLAACSVASALSAAARRATVEASPHVLRVFERGVLFTRRREIPTAELKELRTARAGTIDSYKPLELDHGLPWSLARGRVILARSDKVTMMFGDGLSDEELHWLQRVLEGIATS